MLENENISQDNIHKCKCGDCDCDKNCDCEDKGDCKCDKDCHCGENCNCSDNCTCGDDCHCGEEHCNDDCKCGEHKCHCDDKQDCGCQDGGECNCGDECECDDCQSQNTKDQSVEYLNLAKQIQADFENFRRHAIEDIKQARLSGQESVIEVFLPCLDTFKEAKKSITDENVLKGVEMIENSINGALKSLGVEKMNSIGEKYNPHLHNVIAVMRNEEQDNDIILDEYQAGYKFHDKVIRYAKVIVNKKED